MQMIGAFVIVVLAALVLPALLGRPSVEAWLRKTGWWLPVLAWIIALSMMTLGVMALSAWLSPGLQRQFGGLAFGLWLGAPLSAALFTLAWRDARMDAPSSAADASPTQPLGTRAPRWVRVAAVALCLPSASALLVAAANGAWTEMPGMVALTLIAAYVGLTGRVPSELARRA